MISKCFLAVGNAVSQHDLLLLGKVKFDEIGNKFVFPPELVVSVGFGDGCAELFDCS